MVHAHSAHALVAGCPANGFTLLQSTPYSDNNFFLYGQSAVVTDAYRKKGGTKASKTFSSLWPGPWYAWNQTYIPYNLEGLDGKSIIKEVLQAIPADYAQEQETEQRYRRRVWKLLVDMHGDQKWYSLRFGSWLLSLIFKWLFNGELFVNLDVCSKLRELAPKSTFVYATICIFYLLFRLCFLAHCALVRAHLWHTTEVRPPPRAAGMCQRTRVTSIIICSATCCFRKA